MNQEAIICIPGPWADRSEFLQAIITQEPAGEFMFAGGILAHPSSNDHVPLDFCDRYSEMRQAFLIAGQGLIQEQTLDRIQGHRGIAYLHFPVGWLEQRDRMTKFTQVLQRAGGFAIHVESSGVAHEWDHWFSLLAGSAFDAYCSSVTLVRDADCYYSCGMHHFCLPDCSLPRSYDIHQAADLMNQFNMYQIVDQPQLASGHTFSLDADSPHFRLVLSPDSRHGSENPFHNPHGLWELSPKL
ncbi:DUF4261 domain-containing protein [Luteolibacter pohnpeiensis]|uniref:DUF4261 domain-containing protein n=1 Tax=Luteolibacter pohnpeiensis TaxID=454153 RepID=A0A934SG05_9BACT|nr:DUF4261 domain-containing protein [Luteolibacter pohnpeiensis]MBK1884493.1 DUF4261 domain-containing protein [Luteolibacter pohnpeiensis]